MKSRRHLILLAVAALMAATAFAFPGFSTALFTSTSRSTASVTAAPDWTPPTVSVQDPGQWVKGRVPVNATASDAESGVRDVTLERRASGASAWVTLCVDSTTPYACDLDTLTLGDGALELRARAHDRAGYSATSTTVRTTVDNTAPSVTLADPGAQIGGSRTFSVQAADATSGIAQVTVQVAASGTTTYRELCTRTAAPYTCEIDTKTIGDGTWNLRAVATDRAGHISTSAVRSTRISNRVLAGVDVQTSNGWLIGGLVDRGDTATFTYSDEVDPGSLVPGWDGRDITVEARFRDGSLVGRTDDHDSFDVRRTNGEPVHLGEVNLNEDYVKPGRTATFEATLSASTETVAGVRRTVISIRIGNETGTRLSTSLVLRSSTMVWTPSSAARNTAGTPATTDPVLETGPSDREF